jgi:hypothetical protein
MRVRRERQVKFESIDETGEHDSEYLPLTLTDWREIPSDALEQRELRRLLSEGLASLAPIYREVFLLRDVHEYSIEETAQALRITAGTVKTRLRRARLQMRDAISIGRANLGEIPPGIEEKSLPIPCAEMAREISNYMDDDVSPELRARIENHVRACRRCAALIHSARNILRLVCDRRAFSVPAGLSRYLYAKFAVQAQLRSADS